MAKLEISGLTKRFRHGSGFVEAIHDINLNVAKGDFVAVMGASGSGKSTLLHLVAGLTRPDAGSIHIDDVDINTMSDSQLTRFRRRHVGLVFQAFNLIPSLTGRENVALPMLLGGAARDGQHAAQLITRLGLDGCGDRRPDSMSGGEQQRFAIARALAAGPSLILADEPTGSLDSVNSRLLCETLRALCQENGATVLMVTHNPLVAFAASRFVILQDGRIVHQFDKFDGMTLQDLNQRYIAVVTNQPQEVGA